MSESLKGQIAIVTGAGSGIGAAIAIAFAEAGATVVTSGSTDRAHGLAGRDPQIEQITRNVLNRLGSPNTSSNQHEVIRD